MNLDSSVGLQPRGKFSYFDSRHGIYLSYVASSVWFAISYSSTAEVKNSGVLPQLSHASSLHGS
jgi:hypothetical protein